MRNAVRAMPTDMNEYSNNAIAKFKKEYSKTMHKVLSPYLTNEELAQEGDAGHFSGSSASHMSTLLFFGRVARHYMSVAVRRP